MQWLGIDGGGTKTACTLYDDALAPIDRIVLPTCHYAQAGFDGMRAVLEQGVRWAEARVAEQRRGTAESSARTGANADAATSSGSTNASSAVAATRAANSARLTGTAVELGIGFAICGYGEGAEATARIDELVAGIAGAHPYELVNDVEAAWAAGLDLADGIAIIAGTGSIALGACHGEQLRCGGWDYELGDEGSGGWLGKELLRAFTRQADGRDARGALYDLVRRALDLRDDFDIIAFAQAHYGERGRIAALSPLVTQAAQAGDPSALGILAHAAQEEADMVRAIVHGLFNPARDAGRPVPDPIPVTCIGGTFKAGDLILDPLAAALPRGCQLVAPAREPDLGPVLLLRKRLGR